MNYTTSWYHFLIEYTSSKYLPIQQKNNNSNWLRRNKKIVLILQETDLKKTRKIWIFEAHAPDPCV